MPPPPPTNSSPTLGPLSVQTAFQPPNSENTSFPPISARWVFPVATHPIANGRIERTDHGQIANITSTTSPLTFPNAALLPRPVNLHTHLELSDMIAPLGAGLSLAEWAPRVVEHRARRNRNGTARGLRESAVAGVSVCVDITQPGISDTEILPKAESSPAANQQSIDAKPAHCIRQPHLECIGLSPERSRAVIATANAYLERHPTAGISPHAPYSVAPDLLKSLIDLANRHRRSVTMHVAESPAERDLLERGVGPFRTMLENFGVWDSTLFGNHSLTDVLRELASAERCVIAHGNHLRPPEFELLAGRPSFSVAYCPRTHAFFEYAQHPVVEMLNAGLLVGLGTDSRASTPDLSVWNEVRFLRRTRGDIPPKTLLELATVNSATALGLSDQFGSIQPGRDGDLLVVPLAKPDATDPYIALFGN